MELRVRRLPLAWPDPGSATGGSLPRHQPQRVAPVVDDLRLPVATWRYELHTDGGGGTVLAESVEDHRGALLRTVSPFITGSRNRNERNDATMRTTLDRLKAAAESGR